ncbi:hypothetical protein TraAM80_04028, partial [Trypanosoma rangeli]
EALGLTEERGREDIERAEDAGRCAALEAMQSSATAIASAEALGLTEERGREEIERAEEAGHRAVCDAFFVAHAFGMNRCFYAGGGVLGGMKTVTDVNVSWPSRGCALDVMSADCVGSGARVDVVGACADAVLDASEECHVIAPVVSSVDDVEFDRNDLTDVVELNALSSGIIVGLADASALESPAEVSAEASLSREVAVHPALRGAAGHPAVLPHGDPLGYDSDDDIPIPPRYTLWGCLSLPFACCVRRRPVQVHCVENSLGEE